MEICILGTLPTNKRHRNEFPYAIVFIASDVGLGLLEARLPPLPLLTVLYNVTPQSRKDDIS